MVESLRDDRVRIARDLVLTHDRILEAVSEQLECSGIAGLRLKDVADRLNVSVPSLYRFFEDREAMIAAAYVRDFSMQTLDDVDEFTKALATADSPEDYERGLRRVLVGVFDDDRRQDRWRKVAAIAATRHDPVLLRQIGEVQATFTARIAQVYSLAVERGWVRAPVNPIAFAYAVQGLAMGPLFADVAASPDVTPEDFSEVFVQFHRAMTA